MDLDIALVRVMEVVPNVQPEYAMRLLEQYKDGYKERVHEAVLHALFEDPKYPKVRLFSFYCFHSVIQLKPTMFFMLILYSTQVNSGKKRPSSPTLEGLRSSKQQKIDYASKTRPCNGGPDYYVLAWVRGNFCCP